MRSSTTIAAIDRIAGPQIHFSRGAPARLERRTGRTMIGILLAALLLSAPDFALAQASPFMTGATALQSNARVAREYLVLLPHELKAQARVDLARRFAGELSDRYGFGVDLAVHAPRQFAGSDPRNFHAHLLATTRAITQDGLGQKTEIEWHDVRRIHAGLVPSAQELLHVRRRWAEHANEALAAAGIQMRIDHRPSGRGGAEFSGASAAGQLRQEPTATQWSMGTLEEVRRQAREAWRELRARGEPAREQTRERGSEEDLAR